MKLLDQAGGAAFVTELFTYLPTAANAPHYVEILQEKYALREAIKYHTLFAERAYTEQGSVWEFIEESRTRALALADIASSARGGRKLAVPVSVAELCASKPDSKLTLLGDRYLCVSGKLLFVGPSGIGKSSASMQQDISWGLGRPAFGIQPSKPLKILTIQAENDEADLAEMARGVAESLGLSACEMDQLRNRVQYVTVLGCTGLEFLSVVDRLLDAHRPDILRIDPLLAYIGADINKADETARFLRVGLDRLLERYGCAAIVNHHTPKTTNRDTSMYRGTDWMYSGAGSADITNWARAILVIDPTHSPGIFRFIAAKRGGRIGWRDADGNPLIEKFFRHAHGPLIYWEEASADDIEELKEAAKAAKNGAKKGTPEEFMALVPNQGRISKNDLLEAAHLSGKFGKHTARDTCTYLREQGRLFESERPRRTGGCEKFISRQRPEFGTDSEELPSTFPAGTVISP
jgi:hypothetical protein